MIEKLDAGLACKILIGISSTLIVFHIINILGYIPQNITWLGQIESNRTMLLMGVVSIVLNMIIILCAVIKGDYWNSILFSSIVEKILPIVFWWLVGNTIANLFSKSTFEVVVFTPILVVLTICMYRLKMQPQTKTALD